MKRTTLYLLLLAGLAFGPAQLFAAIRGDTGWSSDGRQYGFCDPEIMPEAKEGCVFFDRDSLEWVETGRKEALHIWKVWKKPAAGSFDKPLLPVYPLDENEKDSGIVKLSARIMSTDAIVEIWRLRKGETPDEKGSDWETVFDYSPDGKWLAAGAVRVNFSDSTNSVHIIARPVSHWLAAAHLRSGLDSLSEGNFSQGLARLSEAGSLFDKALKGKDEEPEKLPAESRSLDYYLDGDMAVERSWVKEMGKLAWSGGGKELCACDAWQNEAGVKRASCRFYNLPSGTWYPIVVEKTRYMCPEPPAAQKVNAGPPPFSFWADWGQKGDAINIVVYMIEKGGSKAGAVLRQELKARKLPLTMNDTAPPLFYAVSRPSPDGKNLAVGFAREASDHSRLDYFIEVDTIESWKKKAQSDMKDFSPGGKKVIEKVPGI
ncbi:MAG: hypothetical protein ABIJ56_17015 [Pseudomonadota bacterium]